MMSGQTNLLEEKLPESNSQQKQLVRVRLPQVVSRNLIVTDQELSPFEKLDVIKKVLNF